MIENNTSSQQPAPTAIDLFCGAGGISLGLQAAGFEILCAADSWDVAVGTYRKNFGHPAACVDLSKCSARELMERAGLPLREVDLIVGGPPCQGFSVQRIGPDDDHRNNLVLHFARLLLELSPRLFLMENVPGLGGKRGHRLLEVFMDTVSSAGYEAEANIVNAADYGVPQVRKRIIVTGWHRTRGRNVVIPTPTHTPKTYATRSEE